MAAKRPSPQVEALLRQRDIALWDKAHYNYMTGRPTTKDPVRVVLVTPRAPDMHFSGIGATTDAAIYDALARHAALREDEGGLLGCLARLEIELHGMTTEMYLRRLDNLGPDDDIPF